MTRTIKTFFRKGRRLRKTSNYSCLSLTLKRVLMRLSSLTQSLPRSSARHAASISSATSHTSTHCSTDARSLSRTVVITQKSTVSSRTSRNPEQRFSRPKNFSTTTTRRAWRRRTSLVASDSLKVLQHSMQRCCPRNPLRATSNSNPLSNTPGQP